MPVRFELGRAIPALRGRSQLVSLAGHGLVGSLLVVMPALTPVALPRVNVPEPGPPTLTPATVVITSPAGGTRSAQQASVPPKTSGAIDPPAPRRVPVDTWGAWADRLLQSEDVADVGPAWGEAAGGLLSAGIPGGLPPGPSSGGSGGPPDAPREIGGDLRRPVLLSGHPPSYPEVARRIRLEGEVLIECVIDAQGSVREARVVSGPPLLRGAALEAVSRWRYVPTTLNGRPVAVRLTVSVRFQLR